MLGNILSNSIAKTPSSRIFDGDGALHTYEDLSLAMEKWQAVFSKENSPVALVADKSFDSLAVYLAVIISQRTLIPIDPHQPINRINDIVKNSQPGHVISQIALKDGDKTEDGFYQYRMQGCSLNAPLILHTSGSTGIPKGVIITEQALSVFSNWAIDEFKLRTSDVLACYAGFHFDLSTFDIIAGIKSGANLWLINQPVGTNFRLLGKYWSEIKPTICYATPTVLTALMQYGNLKEKDAPRAILFAGEVFPIHDLKALRTLWNCSYTNLYGPTETNVVTYYHLPEKIESRTAPYPIGVPCPYATVALNEENEITVSGASVSPGYINQPPRKTDTYATGDLAEYNAEGQLVFVGRTDRMVKYRGVRIEPGEVEQRLSQIKGIDFVTVLIHDNRLVAGYTGEKRSEFSLKISAGKYLAPNMIPSKFVYLATIPLGPTGKLDQETLIDVLNANKG